jgi:hypothetical protein
MPPNDRTGAGSGRVTFTIVKVVEIEPRGDYRLHIAFSDGSSGEHDFGGLVAETGPIVAPQRDSAFFGRVFLEMGIPTWPNGFDFDAIKLHLDMQAAGELRRDAAE